MSVFEHLEQQLLDSVAQRAGTQSRHAAIARLRSRLRARRHGGLVLIAIPLVLAAAAAAATSIATHSGPSPGDVLLTRVLRLTGSGHPTGPCAVTGGRHAAPLSQEAPSEAILASLPTLRKAPRRPPSARVVSMVEHDSGGPVLARTVREVRMPDGIDLIVWVSYGLSSYSTVDPHRCLAARLSTLARLRPSRHDPLRLSVAARIGKMLDTQPPTQSVTLQDGLSGASATLPLEADASRKAAGGAALVANGCARRCGPTLYAGIAVAGASYASVEPVRGDAARHSRPVRHRIAIVEGLFAFRLPPHTGRERIVQRSASGSALSSKELPDPALVLARLRAMSHETKPHDQRPGADSEEERPTHEVRIGLASGQR